jgi:alpha-tubulin suppressor-like RCC1 family protein
MRKIASASALLLGLLAAACNGEVVGGGQRPARVEVVSGDLQSDTVGKEVAQPLVVRVVDERNRPVKNQLVNFVVTAGGGSVFAGAAITNADGEARERWTLGTVAGDTQRVEARAVDPATGAPIVFATFRAVGVPDVPAAASAVGATARTAAAGTAVADSLAIRVVDKHGNAVPGVAVTFAAANGGSVSPATGVTRADGTARAQWTLGPATGPQTATATAAGLPAITFTAAAAAGAVTRVALAPEAISFSALGQTQALTVQAFDAFGNMVGGQQAMIVSQNEAVVALDAGAVARAAGNGTVRLIATVQGSTAADTTVVTVQQVAATVAVTPSTVALFAGETRQLGAQVRDANGHLLTAAAIDWTSSSGAATVSGTGLVQAVASGSATVTATAGSAKGTASVTVTGPLAAQSIAVSSSHSCAVEPGGRAVCWGFGPNGELGSAATDRCGLDPCERLPATVAGGITFASISAGPGETGGVSPTSHTCGLTASGQAYCWGSNRYGELGDGTTTNRSTPVAVAGGLRFLKLSVADYHTCGIATDGKAYCWGRAGALGYAASGTCAAAGCELLPRAVDGGLTFTEIATTGLTSADHTCALTSTGVAYCWGSNSYGELGRSGTYYSQAPAPVATALTFRSIAVGDQFTCAVASDGTAYCWGRNHMAQLGTSAGSFTGANPTPLAVSGGRTYDAVFAGLGHACGITPSGQAYCWGRGVEGQAGNGGSGTYTAPQAVSGGLTWTTLDLGSRHTCGIASSGNAYCWGNNEYGKLGTGDTLPVSVPVLVHERGR